METHQNLWTAFLSPLKSRKSVSHETNIKMIPPNPCMSKDLADQFEHQVKIREEKTQRGKQGREKDPRSIAVNEWTFSKVTEYVSFDKYVRELDLPTQHVAGVSTTESDMNDVYKGVLKMFGAESLEKIMNRESEIRLLIDEIVKELCKRHSLRIMMEKVTKSEHLPGTRFDYLFTTKEGQPIGCIEAKSTKSFNKNAFGQAVMKINILQQLAQKDEFKYGFKVEETPVFCVLSDGYRYVLIMLKGRELLLEVDKATAGKKPAKVINIRKLDSLENYEDLVSAMSCMITMSTNDLPPVKTEIKKEPLAVLKRSHSNTW